MQPTPPAQPRSAESSTGSSPETLRVGKQTNGAPPVVSLSQSSSASSLQLGVSISYEKKTGDSESSSDLSARMGPLDSRLAKMEKKSKKKQDISKYNRILMEILDKIIGDKAKHGESEKGTEVSKEFRTKEREASRKNIARCRENIALCKEKKISLDELFEELAKISGRHELHDILPQVCTLLEQMPDSGAVFSRLIEKMVQKADKKTPFRDDHPGLPIFGFTLTKKMTDLLGKYPFASQVFLAILKVKAKDLDVTSKHDAEVLLNQVDSREILDQFLQNINDCLLKQSPAKRADIVALCSCLSKTMLEEKFDPTKTNFWLLGIVFLRCVSLEVTDAAILLQESKKHRVLGGYMKQFVVYLQKTINSSIDPQNALTDECNKFVKILVGDLTPEENNSKASRKEQGETDNKVSGLTRMKHLFGSMSLSKSTPKS